MVGAYGELRPWSSYAYFRPNWVALTRFRTTLILWLLRAPVGKLYKEYDLILTTVGALIALDLFACRLSLSSTTDRFLNFAPPNFPPIGAAARHLQYR